jgi:hypothetical protein
VRRSQAGLVGEDDGPDPVAEPELSQDRCQVVLDGRLTQHQLRGKLGVTEAPGEQLQDLELSWRQLRQIAVRYGRRGGGRCESLDQPAGHRRRQQRIARAHGTHRVTEEAA